MRRYVVEYDENSVAWLVDVDDKRRVPLVHGMLVAIDLLDGIPSPPDTRPEEDP